MNMGMNSPEEQRKRCDAIAKTVTEYLDRVVSEDGRPAESLGPVALRERLYMALAYVRSGEERKIKKADKILQNAVYHRCHFSPMIALQLLTKYGKLLEEASCKLLLTYVESHMEEFEGDALDYLGVNDNFPSMATYTLIMGGQVLGRPELVRRGKERLGHFKALFTRRGTASEYNSPTYSPIQLLAMAELTNNAEDEEIRETARFCQWRIWADMLGHFHRETCHMAGPYSRAYADDSAAYAALADCSYYALLGDALPVNITNTLLQSAEGCADAYSHNGIVFGQINTVWFTDTVYSCPEELIALAMKKEYPYEMWATTEFTSSTDSPATEERTEYEGELYNYEYPAGTGRITTYMTADYGLGTATHEFHNGIQTDSFHLLYRREKQVQRQRDIGTVYARYLVNEKEPSPDMVLLEDDGRKLGIQKQNTAMVLYKPKPVKQKQVHSMKLSLILPLPAEWKGEVWLGSRKAGRQEGDAESLVGASVSPCSVYIKDGPVYMAYHPLLLTDHGRKNAAAVEKKGNFLMISFYNYEGETRDFTMREFLLTGNGFVAEIGSEEEWGSFEAFRNGLGEHVIRDEWQSTIHSRFSTLRKTSFEKEGLRMECEYSPVTEGIKQISVNGEPLSPEKLHISGFDTDSLPFMN